MRQAESSIQQGFVRWFNYQYHALQGLLFSVPNGGYPLAKRTAKRLHNEGLTKGASDLILFVPNSQYHALCIEMKTATGEQRPEQIVWQQKVESMGYKYVVCHSFDEAKDCVNEYLRNTIYYIDDSLRATLERLEKSKKNKLKV